MKRKFKLNDKVRVLWYKLPVAMQVVLPKNIVGTIIRLYDSTYSVPYYEVKIEGGTRVSLAFREDELVPDNSKTLNGDTL